MDSHGGEEADRADEINKELKQKFSDYSGKDAEKIITGWSKTLEKGNSVSSEIALAVINTLGAIGDKAAFDSLLAVTYLNYEESVLTAAREALSGLRWQ